VIRVRCGLAYLVVDSRGVVVQSAISQVRLIGIAVIGTGGWPVGSRG
jgi:hypothetical protein